MPDQVTIPFYPPDSNPFTPGATPPGFPSTPPWLPPPVGPDTNYAPQDPGDYPGAPPPGPAPPDVTPPGSPPGASPTFSDYLAFGMMTNPFYRTARVIRKTRLTRFLESEARVGLDALKGWWQGEKTLATVIRQGTEAPWITLAGFRAAVTRNAIGAIVLGAIFPDPVDETGQFPLPLKILAQGPFALQVRRMVAADQFTRSRRVPSDAVKELMSRAPDVTLGLRPPTLVERLHELSDEANRFNIGRLLNPSGWTPFRMPGGKVTATAPGFNDYVPPALTVPADLGVGPQAAAPSTSSSTSSPTSGPRAGKGGRLQAGQIRWGRIGIGVGAIVAANSLLPRLFGGSAYASSPIGAATIAPDVTGTGPAPGTLPQPGFYGAGAYGSSGGYCTPAPRGPRRKCLERAPVAWRAGRNKGKAAGSKCVRYAQRAR